MFELMIIFTNVRWKDRDKNWKKKSYTYDFIRQYLSICQFMENWSRSDCICFIPHHPSVSNKLLICLKLYFGLISDSVESSLKFSCISISIVADTWWPVKMPILIGSPNWVSIVRMVWCSLNAAHLSADNRFFTSPCRTATISNVW